MTYHVERYHAGGWLLVSSHPSRKAAIFASDSAALRLGAWVRVTRGTPSGIDRYCPCGECGIDRATWTPECVAEDAAAKAKGGAL